MSVLCQTYFRDRLLGDARSRENPLSLRIPKNSEIPTGKFSKFTCKIYLYFLPVNLQVKNKDFHENPQNMLQNFLGAFGAEVFSLSKTDKWFFTCKFTGK